MTYEMTHETARLVVQAQAAWKSLKEVQAWDQWRTIGYAIDAARTDIMRDLKINDPDSKRLKDEMGVWLKDTGFNEIDKGARSRLKTCMEHLTLIEAWREKLSPSDRVRLNHPQTIWSNFKKTLEDAVPKPPRTTAKDEQVELLEAALEDLRNENEGLREKLAATETNADRDWDGAGRVRQLETELAERTRELVEARAELARRVEPVAGAERAISEDRAAKVEKPKRTARLDAVIAAHAERSETLPIYEHLDLDGRSTEPERGNLYRAIYRAIQPGERHHARLGTTYSVAERKK